nr:MAG: nonstructural polyprotein [Totiviridae sp.]
MTPNFLSFSAFSGYLQCNHMENLNKQNSDRQPLEQSNSFAFISAQPAKMSKHNLGKMYIPTPPPLPPKRKWCNIQSGSVFYQGLQVSPPVTEHKVLDSIDIFDEYAFTSPDAPSIYKLNDLIPDEHMESYFEYPFGLPVRSGIKNTIYSRGQSFIRQYGNLVSFPLIGTQAEVYGMYPNGVAPTVECGSGLVKACYDKLLGAAWPSHLLGYVHSQVEEKIMTLNFSEPSKYQPFAGKDIIVVEFRTHYNYQYIHVRMSHYDFFCFLHHNHYGWSDTPINLLETRDNKFFASPDDYVLPTDVPIDQLTDDDIWQLIFSEHREVYPCTDDYQLWKRLYKRPYEEIAIFNKLIYVGYPGWYCLAQLNNLSLPKPSTIPSEKPAVQIQMGLFDTLASYSKSSNGKDETMTLSNSIKSMGRLADTVNSLTSSLDNSLKDPTSHVYALFMKLSRVAKYTDDILSAAVDFMDNPYKTIQHILTHWKLEFDIKDLTLLDSLWLTLGYVGITGLACYFHHSNPVISSGFLLLANYHLVSQLTTFTSSQFKIAVALTVATIGLLQLPQSHPDCIEIQSEISVAPMAAAFAATLGTAIAGFSSYSSFSDIFKFTSNTMKPFVMTARGLPFIASAFEHIGTLLSKIVTYFFGDSCVWLALSRGAISDDQMREYIEYALTYQPDDIVTTISLDPAERAKWDLMCKHHHTFITLFANAKTRPSMNHIGYSMYNKAFSAFKELLAEFQKSRTTAASYRPEPFIFWMYGDPGVGKTLVRDSIANTLYVWHRDLEPSLPSASETGMMYVRNPGDKYWTGYGTSKGAPFAAGWDDVGMNLKSDNAEFDEIMAAASTNLNILNMADLKDKGRTFASRVMILCANTRDAYTNSLVLSEKALNRRRHIVLEVQRPRVSNVSCKTSKADFSQMRLVVRDNESSDSILAIFPSEEYCNQQNPTWTDTGHCSYSPVKSIYAETNLVWDMFYKWLKPIYIQHVHDQQEIIQKKDKELMKTIHPELYELAELNSADPDITGSLQLVRQNPDDPIIEENFVMKYVAYFRKQPSEIIMKWIKTPAPITFSLSTEQRDKINDCIEHLRLNIPSAKKGLIALTTLIGTIAASTGIYALCRKFFGKKEPTVQAYDNSVKYAPKGKHAIIQQKIVDVSGAVSFQSLLTEASSSSDPIPPRNTWRLVDMKVASFMRPMAKFFRELPEDLSDPELKVVYFLAKSFVKNNRKGLEIGEWSANAKISTTTMFLPPNLIDVMPEFQSLTSDLFPIYEKALYLMSAVNSSTSYRRVHAINIKGRLFLVPYHFVHTVDKEIQIQLTHATIPTRNVNITPEQIHRIAKTDWCIIHMAHGMPEGRDILNHFATREELQCILTFDAMLMSYGRELDNANKRLTHAYVGDAKRFDVPISGHVNGKEVVHPQGYVYHYPTVFGMCGAPLIAVDSTVRSKIMGMHFAYSESVREAYASLISRESLLELCNKLVPPESQIVINHPPAIQCKFVEKAPEFLGKYGEPLFECVGYITNPASQARKHRDLFRSPAWNEVYPAAKDLSVLSHFDSRLEDDLRGLPTMLNRNFIGYSTPTCEWPTKELKMARSLLLDVFNSFRETTKREVKSLEWAINGEWIGDARLEHAEAVRLETSAGYGFPGKKQLYFDTTDAKNIKISDSRLQNETDSLWEQWKNGNSTGIVWTNALKSEPLKMSKIGTGKTRTFSVCPTAALLNIRRLFGAWTVAMKNSKIKTFSCLGMDVRSGDWSYLYSKLREVGPNGLDLDFQNYDRIAVIDQLVSEIAEAINEWYDDGPTYARMRKIVIHEIIYSFMLCGDIMLRKFQGNPSGNPLTTEMNNCSNFLKFVIVFLLIAKLRSPDNYSIKSFKRNVCIKTYGDDVIITLSPECEEWFDVSLVTPLYALHGITVTPADKESVLSIKPLEQLTFLKCSFVPSNIPTHPWNAGLSKTSIENMMQFYRLQPNNGTLLEAVEHNFIESCEFAYFWGCAYYEQHRNNCNKWLKQQTTRGFKPITLTFEELDTRYRIKLGIEQPQTMLSPSELENLLKIC